MSLQQGFSRLNCPGPRSFQKLELVLCMRFMDECRYFITDNERFPHHLITVQTLFLHYFVILLNAERELTIAPTWQNQ